jgi:predicted RNase H-like HicB family nuclease
MSEPMKFAVIIERGEHNFSAYSPDLPGCVTTGTTEEETLGNMKEAIRFHLQGLEEDRREAPQSSAFSAHIVAL